MKKLQELPETLQEDLSRLRNCILSEIPSTALIFLYGDCSREPFDGPDYDLLVVTCSTSAHQAKINIEKSKGSYYCSQKTKHKHLNIITVSIGRFFGQLSTGNYFFKEVVTTGIKLHNAKSYTIIPPRKVSLKPWVENARTYFQVSWSLSGNFLRHAAFDLLSREYTLCAFQLHQACEQLYRAMHLVHTLEIPREHDMEELITMTRKYDPELNLLFGKNKRDIHLLTTFKNAYSHSRYDPSFKVNYNDIRRIWPKVMRLRKITRRVCQGKINTLDEAVGEKRTGRQMPGRFQFLKGYTALFDAPLTWITSIDHLVRKPNRQ